MRALLLAATLCLACPRSPPPPPLVFEPEARVMSAQAARDPKLVVRASGDLFALVARPVAEGNDVVLLKSSDGGDVFETVATLNTRPGEALAHGETSPRLLLGPRSEFYAVWTSAEALRVARSKAYGRSFEPPVTVPTGGKGPSFFTAALTPDGTLLLAWFGRTEGRPTRQGTTHLNLAVSRDGETFESLPAVATDVCPCCRPAITADAEGRWYLAWRGVGEEEVRDIVVSVTSDGGKTWSPPRSVAPDAWKLKGCPHSGPSLLVADGRLHVAWYSEGDGTGTAFWSRAPLGTVAFEPRRVLSEGVVDANHPVLAAEGARVWAAFQGRDPHERGGWGPLQIYVRPLAEGAPVVRAPAGKGSAAYPELISMAAGRWLLAWNASDDQGTRVALARFRTTP